MLLILNWSTIITSKSLILFLHKWESLLCEQRKILEKIKLSNQKKGILIGLEFRKHNAIRAVWGNNYNEVIQLCTQCHQWRTVYMLCKGRGWRWWQKNREHKGVRCKLHAFHHLCSLSSVNSIIDNASSHINYICVCVRVDLHDRQMERLHDLRNWWSL